MAALTIYSTAIHWHGLHQNGTVLYDGPPGITQCPIPPGNKMTYSFVAQQYGTTWYHSHFTAQYGNGVVGTVCGHISLYIDVSY
jgi:FtsP/CotA-like multicopper oxidase with cupredoxin domain